MGTHVVTSCTVPLREGVGEGALRGSNACAFLCLPHALRPMEGATLGPLCIEA